MNDNAWDSYNPTPWMEDAPEYAYRSQAQANYLWHRKVEADHDMDWDHNGCDWRYCKVRASWE